MSSFSEEHKWFTNKHNVSSFCKGTQSVGECKCFAKQCKVSQKNSILLVENTKVLWVNSTNLGRTQ